MSAPIRSSISFSLSGSGTGFDDIQVPIISDFHTGRLLGWTVREEAAGTLTLADVWVVQSDSAISSTPIDNDVRGKALAQSFTASATAADIDEMFDNPNTFDGQQRFVVNATTAPGAWVMDVTLHYEFDVRGG